MPNFQKIVSEHLKGYHIWLIKFLKKLSLFIFFIHIIQIALFNSELAAIGKYSLLKRGNCIM